MANVNGAARLQVPVLKAPLAALVSAVAPAPVARAPATHVLVTPDHAFPGQLASSTLATRVPAQLLNSAQTVKATLHTPAATGDGEVSEPQRFLGALQAGVGSGWDAAKGPVTKALTDTMGTLAKTQGRTMLDTATKAARAAGSAAPVVDVVGKTFVSALKSAASAGGSHVAGAAAGTGVKTLVQGAGGSLPAVGNVITAGFALMDGADWLASCVNPHLNGLERMGKMLKFQCSAAAVFLPAGSGLVSLAGNALGAGLEGFGASLRTGHTAPAATPPNPTEMLSSLAGKLTQGGLLDGTARTALTTMTGVLHDAGSAAGLKPAQLETLNTASRLFTDAADKGLRKMFLEGCTLLQKPEVARQMGTRATHHVEGALATMMALQRVKRGSAPTLPEKTAEWAGLALRSLAHTALAMQEASV